MPGRIKQATGRYGGRSAAERQSERRQRFLDAGLEMFGGSPGYRATKVAALSEAAGLSTRQFYEEFHTLEDLLAELHLQVNDHAERELMAALPELNKLDPVDRATRLVRVYIDAVTSDPRRTRIAFVEIIGVSPRMDRQRLTRRAGWVDLLSAEMTEAAARGLIAPRDFRVTATAFIGAINGLMHDWSMNAVEATLDQITQELTQMLLGSLGVNPNDPL